MLEHAVHNPLFKKYPAKQEVLIGTEHIDAPVEHKVQIP